MEEFGGCPMKGGRLRGSQGLSSISQLVVTLQEQQPGCDSSSYLNFASPLPPPGPPLLALV